MMRKERGRQRSGMALLAGASLTFAGPLAAAEFDTGVKDLTVRWDNTLKYSAAARVREPSGKITSQNNFDDGDRNFKRGLISNRGDWLTELDVTYASFGGRVSAAAWYDDVYNRKTGAAPGFSNAFDVPYNRFPKDTARLEGREIELLDAFLFKKFKVDGASGVGRIGRHSLVYGETLFMGANGIAAAQGPIDAIKALQVPNTQYKELGRPINQVSADIQFNSNWAIGGYYQFEWERNRIPPSGSFFSPADAADVGGQSIRATATLNFWRAEDIKARDQGQFGLKLRYRDDALGTDFGLYAANYHDKNFNVYAAANRNANFGAGKLGEYQLVFAEDIQTYGVSANTTVGDASVATEFSWRHNTPFSPPGGGVSVGANELADNGSFRRYAVGDSAHLNVSVISVLPSGPFWEGLNILGEVGANRRVSVAHNLRNLDPNTTRYAVGTRLVITPSYYQVIPGLDIDVPIGIGYNPYGRSSVASFGAERGGDMSIGLKGTLNNAWVGTMNYTHFYGRSGTVTDPATSNYSFDQVYKDRDFISLSLSRMF